MYVSQEPFINISTPKIDRDYSLYRTYVIFRTLGLRHLVVVDGHNRCAGIITRKDLMQFQMQEKLESLLALTAVRTNSINGRRGSGAGGGDYDSNNNMTDEDDDRKSSISSTASGDIVYPATTTTIAATLSKHPNGKVTIVHALFELN